jgi:hypothetical protein
VKRHLPVLVDGGEEARRRPSEQIQHSNLGLLENSPVNGRAALVVRCDKRHALVFVEVVERDRLVTLRSQVKNIQPVRRDLVNVCTSLDELFADLHSTVMACKMHGHKLEVLILVIDKLLYELGRTERNKLPH